MKRVFLMLAQKHKEQSIGGWLWSEKLDGMRAFWDGGFTRGQWADEFPYCNTQKDARLKDRVKCSGLWSRYGKVVRAPDWWLDKLPEIPLDGELYMGRGMFQTLRSRVSTFENSDWTGVQYSVFDSPNRTVVWGAGEINVPNMNVRFPAGVLTFLGDCQDFAGRSEPFGKVYERLSQTGYWNDVVQLHPQKLVDSPLVAEMAEIVAGGGEGIIVRNPQTFWVPNRTHNLLKMKPFIDDEAVVVGYVTGQETDRGSKFLGLMGALKVRWHEKDFEIGNGFTDVERELSDYKWACLNPKTVCPLSMWAKHFPRNSLITFKYRELTDAGIPKEATYWRKHESPTD